jgi:hypothetical protein
MFYQNKTNKTQAQSGVTLLLSVLVMSGLALVTLSLGVVLTEPAIAAAESAGEQGLWAIKRGAALSSCPSAGSQALGNSLSVLCKTYGAATFDLNANEPFVFYLYDPNNINSNTCNTVSFNPCSGAQIYQTMTVDQANGTFQTDIDVDTVDGFNVTSQSISPGSDVTINIPSSVSGSSDLRFKVTLVSTGDATVVVNTNQGMPTFPTVNATGCSSKTAVADCNTSGQEIFSRKIQITVPQ